MSCKARLDTGKVERDDLGIRRLGLSLVEQALRLAIGLDESDVIFVASREPEVTKRLVVHRKEPAGGAVFRSHVCDGCPVGDRQAGETVAEVLYKLSDYSERAEGLRHREHEIRRCRPL